MGSNFWGFQENVHRLEIGIIDYLLEIGGDMGSGCAQCKGLVDRFD